jgi:UDP-N-acetylmuramoylalanine--D-glutamate ligase
MQAVADDVMPLDLDRLDLESFRDQPVAVLGLARSGVALARFLHDRGARVTAYDARSLADLAESVAALEGREIRLLVGPDLDPALALRGQALITTSPSVSSRFPTTEPRLRGALAALEAQDRVPVVSEVDLFLRLSPAVSVGVTGTKGKTTTASLTGAILERGSAPVLVGGNIGRPLVERLPELTAGHRIVLELSELQLPTLSRGTQVAVYTHVTQDHLDRHGSVEAYRAVKARLAELVPAAGALIVNAEDPVSGGYDSPERPLRVSYRRRAPLPGGLGIVDDWIVAAGVARVPAGAALGSEAPAKPFEGQVMEVARIPLPGEHNRSNVLAAAAVGLLFGVEPSAIGDAVAGFGGVPHRLETVAVRDGVRYVNDSQGTQPDAVVAALHSYPRPLVLIAGGRDKGVPLEEMARAAAERASAVVLIGENADRLEAVLRLAGQRRLERAADLASAVRRADQLARAEPRGPEGLATVLLSPAAASFDMFRDYEARGEAFRAAVADLAEEAP